MSEERIPFKKFTEGDFIYEIRRLNRVISKLKDKIEKATKIVESYNLGKYDYSVPPGGIIDLLEVLKGEENE